MVTGQAEDSLKIRLPTDSRRSRLLLTVVVTLVAFGAGSRPAAPQEVKVTIERTRFVPAEIRVGAGRPLVLVVTNRDDVIHEFEIETLDVEKRVGVGQTVRISIPAPKPGRYEVEDDDSTPPLKGVLIVE
jgi:heme/copper-type cytochrome/quinol oxidase subunit 2